MITLRAQFNPPNGVPSQDFFNEWKVMHLSVKYDGIIHRILIDEKMVAALFASFRPNPLDLPITPHRTTTESPSQSMGVINYGETSSQGKSSVGTIVGKNPPVALVDKGKGNVGVFDVISDGSVPIPPKTPLPWPGTEFSKLSNIQLKKLALAKASQIRTFALKWDHSDALQSEFSEKFRGTGAALAEEILARQNIFPPYTFQVQLMYPIALQGHFAGPNPVADVAVFLEDRARMLPDD